MHAILQELSLMKKNYFSLLFLSVFLVPQLSMAKGSLESATLVYEDNFTITFTFDGTINLGDYDPTSMSREGGLIFLSAKQAIRAVTLHIPLASSNTTPVLLEWEKPEYIGDVLLQYDTSTGEFSVRKMFLIFPGAIQPAVHSSFVEATHHHIVVGYTLKGKTLSRNQITKSLTKSEFNTTKNIAAETLFALKNR